MTMQEPRMRSPVERWALLPLRLAVGFGFAFHGYAKVARGPGNFAAILLAMGVPAAHPMAWATSLLELLGGVALMLGAFVGPLSLPLAAVMATAMFGVHLQYGFSSVRLTGITEAGAQFGPVGYEVNLLYIASLLALAWSESSPLSLDRWLAARRGAAARDRRERRQTRSASPAATADASGRIGLRVDDALSSRRGRG